MTLIKKHWRSITLVYLILAYLGIIVIAHASFQTLILAYAAYSIVFIAFFFGTFLGVIGLLLQMITKSEKIALLFYPLAYKFKTENTTLLASYGLILLRQEKNTEAKEVFEKALSHSTYYLTEKTLMANLAITEWKLGHLQKAIDMYLAIIKQFGTDDQAFLKEPDYSDEMIGQLVADNFSMYPQDYTTLGYLYLLAEDIEKALFFSKAALQKKEHFAAAYDNLGQIYLHTGDLESAKEQFELALKYKPNLPDSLYFLGLIYEKEGNTIKALEFYEKALAGNLDGLNTVTRETVVKHVDAIKHAHAFLS